ncbi:MAG TPA: MFS transporter [Solirubrobacteraceae bacterium]|jgi:DHA3 family tetracycline resistance protein-like MFS transporter|nr:MFS transporter [Solirubrobacteraceae bacterium]
MQHSYEGLDRIGGFDRVRLLAPLAHRDYRLLVGGMSVSLLGDGLFLVALAWQVYALSNAPTALASVGIAMTIPTIVCLLLGGAVSDRYDRRMVMLCADAVRALGLGVLAALSVSGSLRLWELMAVGVVYGAATAFFDPASDALVPQLLPAEDLAQANSLDQLIRPLALRLAGPAVGGALIAAIGVGWSFGLDAASFVVSAATLLAMSPVRRAVSDSAAGGVAPSVRHEIAAGLRYVRSHAWLWATLVSAAVAYLLFMGPTEVLLPFVVKNRLSDGAGALGLVFAAGGLGSLLCAIVIGQRGLPRRALTFMYICWTLATLAIAGYGLSSQLWGLMIASVAFNSLETAGTIAWATTKQRLVPAELLGRVSSLDWLISIGLLPVSFAITGPVSAALGLRTTLIGAGVLGAAVTFAALLVPGVRQMDEPGATAPMPSGIVLAPIEDTIGWANDLRLSA